jgi:hypothetical protein
VIAGPLRVKVRDRLYQRQADASAQEWLQLLAKAENQQALNGMTGNAKMYLMGPPSPGGQPQSFDEQMYLVKLGEDPLAAKLQEEAQHGDLEFAVREFSSNADGPNPRAEVTYQTVKPDDSLTMKLVLLRSISPSRGGEWLVDSWRLESETAHDHAHPHSH